MRITRRDLNDTVFDLTTGRVHHFDLRDYLGYVLEVDDVHFNFDSAVFLPDHDVRTPRAVEIVSEEEEINVTGLAVIRTIYLHAKARPAQKLLIAGHTDTAGARAYNQKLSSQRADNFKHVLLGERDAWVESSHAKHTVRDYQQILAWVARAWAVHCDPDGIDGRHGARTTAALERFQQMYNDEFDAQIAVDGAIGPETWGAFFDIYMEILADMVGVDVAELAAERARLKFLDPDKKAVGCGENFPVDLPGVDGRRSATNRRLQVLFFDPGEEPKLDCHPKSTQCKPSECELYAKRMHFFRPLEPEPAPLLPRYRLELALGDLDGLMTPIDQENGGDRGVCERLQALGHFYTDLIGRDAQLPAAVRERSLVAWEHFKAETGKSDDASAVAELRRLVKEHVADGGVLPKPGEQRKLRVPGTWCYVGGDVHGGDSGGRRHADESSVWKYNPYLGVVPIEAKVEAKFRRKFKPAGGVNVHFQLIEPDPIEPGHALAAPAPRASGFSITVPDDAGTANVTIKTTGHPDAYVEAQRARDPALNGDPLVDNVHEYRGGKRGARIASFFAEEKPLGRFAHFYEPHGLERAEPSPHSHAMQVTSNDRGEAVALFRSSFTGGDRYRFRAFLDPLRRRRSDGSEKHAVAQQTGTWVVWRSLRISKYVRWDYPSAAPADQRARCGGVLEDISLAVLSKEFAKAWLETAIDKTAKTPHVLTPGEHRAAILAARAKIALNPPTLSQRYHFESLIRDTGASPGFVDMATKDEYDAALRADPVLAKTFVRAPRASATWFDDMSAIADNAFDLVVQHFTQDAIGGITLVQAPAPSSHVADPQDDQPYKTTAGRSIAWQFLGCATPHRGCWVVGGKGSYAGFRHDLTTCALHEIGHVLHAPHQYDAEKTKIHDALRKTKSTYADSHDYDDICVMSYIQCKNDFCGRCLLRLAGWNTSTMPANSPADSPLQPRMGAHL